jgi:hypothetical protein
MKSLTLTPKMREAGRRIVRNYPCPVSNRTWPYATVPHGRGGVVLTYQTKEEAEAQVEFSLTVGRGEWL